MKRMNMTMSNTYNLDYAFADWLSAQLKNFLKLAEEHTDLEIEVVVCGEQMPQIQAIKKLQYLLMTFQVMVQTGKGNKVATLRAVGLIWADLLPYMWL